MMEKSSNYYPHALSYEEVEKCFNDGLLSKSIYRISFNLEQLVKNPHYRKLDETELKSFGIKEFFMRQDTTGPSPYEESFFLTDLYLIVYERYIPFSNESPNFTIIPLQFVETCKLEYGSHYDGYVDAQYVTKQKDPVKGAVIGGILAGSTGAVIGAVAGSGEKKELISAAKNIHEDRYSMIIKIKDGERVVKEDYIKADSNSNAEWVKSKNDHAQQLIDRAKTLANASLEEKRKIVGDVVKTGEIENTLKNIGYVAVGLGLMIGLGVLMAHF